MRLVSGPTDTALQFVIESHQPKNVPYTVKQCKVTAGCCHMLTRHMRVSYAHTDTVMHP